MDATTQTKSVATKKASTWASCSVAALPDLLLLPPLSKPTCKIFPCYDMGESNFFITFFLAQMFDSSALFPAGVEICEGPRLTFAFNRDRAGHFALLAAARSPLQKEISSAKGFT